MKKDEIIDHLSARAADLTLTNFERMLAFNALEDYLTVCGFTEMAGRVCNVCMLFGAGSVVTFSLMPFNGEWSPWAPLFALVSMFIASFVFSSRATSKHKELFDLRKRLRDSFMKTLDE